MAARKPTRQTIAFGQEVTRLRNELGLSRLDLAKRAAVSRSYVAQVENGTTRCRRDFAVRLDEALGTGTTLADAWEDILKSSVHPKFFTDYSVAESSAALLRAYHETFIYGLLQIEEYARTLLTTDTAYEGRIRRQQILKAETAPTICVVIGESVLLREVGGPAVMRQQLEHLIEASLWENVTLQIAPTAYYRGISGSFDLATQASGEELLYQETSTGGVTSSERDDILHIVKAFSMLQGQALSTDASREFIRKVISERWTTMWQCGGKLGAAMTRVARVWSWQHSPRAWVCETRRTRKDQSCFLPRPRSAHCSPNSNNSRPSDAERQQIMDVVTWHKARRSNDQGGECVELGALPEGVGVRDSKDPEGPRLVLDPAAFRALLTDLKHR